MFIGVGSNFWGNSLFVLPENLVLIDSEFISIFNKLLVVFLSLLGGIFSYLFYRYSYKRLYLFKIGDIESLRDFKYRFYQCWQHLHNGSINQHILVIVVFTSTFINLIFLGSYIDFCVELRLILLFLFLLNSITRNETLEPLKIKKKILIVHLHTI